MQLHLYISSQSCLILPHSLSLRLIIFSFIFLSDAVSSYSHSPVISLIFKLFFHFHLPTHPPSPHPPTNSSLSPSPHPLSLLPSLPHFFFLTHPHPLHTHTHFHVSPIHTLTHTDTLIPPYTPSHPHTHTHTHTFPPIYTRTHAHTHTRTHIHSPPLSFTPPTYGVPLSGHPEVRYNSPHPDRSLLPPPQYTPRIPSAPQSAWN